MQKVLEMLTEAEYVSGEQISAALGISRTAVWKKIEQLRQEGWKIEAAGKRGYRLDPEDRLDPVLWQKQLPDGCCGKDSACFLQEVDSTNLRLKQLAVQGAPHGTVCLAECQTAGRGRLGRGWESPAGKGLYLSVLLRPQLPPDKAPFLTLCTAMAMNHAVRQCTGLDSAIKWPNDLVCRGKKLCGILLEISADPDQIEYVVIGTGLNVRPGCYPPELADRAASLEELGSNVLRRDLLVVYLQELTRLAGVLEEQGFAGLREQYRRESCTIGSRVRVIGSQSFIGTAEDIDETGALLVRDEEGTLRRVLSGDVSVRGIMGYV